MRGFNKLFLMGRLGSDPQSYVTKNGKNYVGLNLATHRNGSLPSEALNGETTDWHFVRVYGKAAENCAKYLAKGRPVFVEGYLTQYKVPNLQGVKENRTGINAIKVEFLPHNGARPAAFGQGDDFEIDAEDSAADESDSNHESPYFGEAVSAADDDSRMTTQA